MSLIEIAHATQVMQVPDGNRLLFGASVDGIRLHLWTLVGALEVADRTICGLDVAPDRDVRDDDLICEGCELLLFRILGGDGKKPS
jgi:hypothetical protein